MSEFRQNECLLGDVLSEGTAAGFREGLLNQTLRLARRRRCFRQARRATSVLALLAGVGMLVCYRFPSKPAPEAPSTWPCAMIHTQPLPPAAWVVTRPLAPENLVISASVSRILVATKGGERVREINDDELLALVTKPAALVRRGPHSAELVFVSSADREELLRN